MELTPEQQRELQEKLKNMSPEEIKEFQKKQCIFCQIISGAMPARKVYEDEHALAILDINPANPGHVLLLPKEHYVIMPQIPDEDVRRLFILTKKMSHSLLKATGAKGTNIFAANGLAAGQKAQHFVIHVIPRKEDDGINMDLPKKDMETPEELLDKLIPALNEMLGKPPDNPNSENREDSGERKKLKENKTKEKNIEDENSEDESYEEESPEEQEKSNLDDISRILLGGGK